MELKDKVVAITGAGSGIGRALAVQVAGAGGRLALADINAGALAATERELQCHNAIVSRHVVDVARRDEVEGFAQAAVEQHGAVDILINNAGVALLESIEDGQYDDLEWIVGINFWGVVHGTKAFLPHLRKRREAAIVNMSSIAGLAGLPVQAAYSATKFAIRGFSEAMRLELSQTAVKIVCVHAGGVRTNIVRNARYYKNPDDPTKPADQVVGAQRFEKTYALTTAEAAAMQILKGLRRDKTRILVGWDAVLIDWLCRFCPSLLPKLLMAYAKRREA